MNSFNPFSAQLKSSRANNTDNISSDGHASSGLDLLPSARATGTAPDCRAGNPVHADDLMLDDFGKPRYSVLGYH